MSDALQRFHFEGLPIRGAHVRLDGVLAHATTPHDYAPAVANLLAELLTATSLLASTIRNRGVLTLQVRGDGPVSLAMAECRDGDALRGIARTRATDAPTLRSPPGQGGGARGEAAGAGPGALPLHDFGALLGRGDLAITMQRPDGEPWQGIVSIDQGRLEWALEDYFHRSEQLDTRLWLASGAHYARGLLLQRLPARDAEMHADLDTDAWERATTLAASVTHEELGGLDCPTLLQRLFALERVRLTDYVPQAFRCSCSRERTAGALRIMGEQEVRQILREEGEVRVECQFCRQSYAYAASDLVGLFDDN